MFTNIYNQMYLLVLAIIILAVMCMLHTESFANKDMKLAAINQWGKSNDLSFNSYRKKIGGDIVEYTDVKQYLTNPNSINIEKYILQ